MTSVTASVETRDRLKELSKESGLKMYRIVKEAIELWEGKRNEES